MNQSSIEKLRALTEELEKEEQNYQASMATASAIVLNNPNIDDLLSDKARAAFHNSLNATIINRDSKLEGCIFISQSFYNDGNERGQISGSLTREWARMLNDLAENGWDTSLAGFGVMQLTTPSEVDYQSVVDGLLGKKTSPPDWALTEEAKRPRVAVFSFIFINGVSSSKEFNEKFNTDIAMDQGVIGPVLEQSAFNWNFGVK